MDPTATPENSPMLRWSSLFLEAAAKTGLDGSMGSKLAPHLQQAGFVDIRAKNYKWPVGRWAKGAKMKLLGYYVFEDLRDWLPSSALALFTRVLKWTREEVELFLADCRRELNQRNGRKFYANVFFWTARKPLDAPTQGWSQAINEDEEVIEADEEQEDDDREEEADEDNTQSTAESAAAESAVPGSSSSSSMAPAPLASPGPLVSPTAGLSLESPVLDNEKGSTTLPSLIEPLELREPKVNVGDTLSPENSPSIAVGETETSIPLPEGADTYPPIVANSSAGG